MLAIIGSLVNSIHEGLSEFLYALTQMRMTTVPFVYLYEKTHPCPGPPHPRTDRLVIDNMIHNLVKFSSTMYHAQGGHH